MSWFPAAEAVISGIGAQQYQNYSGPIGEGQNHFDLIPQTATPQQRASLMALMSNIDPSTGQYLDTAGQFGKYATDQTRAQNVMDYLSDPNAQLKADAGHGGGWLGNHLDYLYNPVSQIKGIGQTTGRISNQLTSQLERMGIPTAWAENWGTMLSPGAGIAPLTNYYAARQRGESSTDARQFATNDAFRSLASAAAVYGGGAAAGAWGGGAAGGGAGGAGGGLAGDAGSFGSLASGPGIPSTMSGGFDSAIAGGYGGLGGTTGGGLMGTIGQYGPLVSGALGLAGSIIGSNAQQAGQQRAIDAQMAMYGQTRGDLMPYNAAGYAALNPLMSLAGQNPTDLMNRQGWLERTPGYQFARNQGLQAVQNSASARGLGVSGAAQRGAADYATGLADNTYQNQFNNALGLQNQRFNQLMGVATLGQNAAAQTGAFGTQTAANVGNNLVGQGNAAAAGILGGANALGQGANQYYQQWLLNQMLRNQGYQGLYG